ncbi:MAG: radical SAM protein [Candidatus Altiarchaeales archaeon]|nr:radical SAM protein [Candidatus Altiarchaeales archaeon]
MSLEIFQVEITSRCNMRCSFCPHSEMTRDKKDMSLSEFSLVAKNFRRGQRVGLHVMGEPLLNISFEYIVKETIMEGALPEIATNSLALSSPERRRDILLSGLQLMILDISRYKEEQEVMQKAIYNAEATVGLACELFAKGYFVPQILLQIVLKKGVRQCFSADMVNKAFLYPEVLKLHSKFLDSWAGHRKDLAEKSFVSPPEKRTPCAEPWNRVVVLQDGSVVPCCRDAFGQIVYGNIFKTSLQDIEENSPVLRDLRDKMMNQEWDLLPEPCRSCREWHIPMDRRVGDDE